MAKVKIYNGIPAVDGKENSFMVHLLVLSLALILPILVVALSRDTGTRTNASEGSSMNYDIDSYR